MKPQFYREVIAYNGIVSENVWACCEKHGLITSDDPVPEECRTEVRAVGYTVDSNTKGLRLVLERDVVGTLFPAASD